MAKYISRKSIFTIFEENNLNYLIYGTSNNESKGTYDPIHLNDVEPVFLDGKYWKSGDVFLSIRSRSMIALYRPSTNKIVWKKQGPWINQHDVNIVNENQISVFDNNAYQIGDRDFEVRGSNRFLVYDFQNDIIINRWESSFAKHKIKTKRQGRAGIIDNKVFVEETEAGRLLLLSSDGDKIWEYTNKAADGRVYALTWSRLIEKSIGDEIKYSILTNKC